MPCASSIFGCVAQSDQPTQCSRWVAGAGTLVYFDVNCCSCVEYDLVSDAGVQSVQPRPPDARHVNGDLETLRDVLRPPARS